MRCTIYLNPTASVPQRARCTQPATVLLLDENGQPCPGGQCCSAHAGSIIQEYQTKLGITWTTVAVDEHGEPIHA